MQSTKDTVFRCAESIAQSLRTLLGDDRVTLVFLAGSCARDEVAFAHADGAVEIYSDIDLYAVLAEGVDLAEAREQVARAYPEWAALSAQTGFLRDPDVGVYTIADLSSQPCRPGTVAFSETSRVLFGDSEQLLAVSEAIGDTMDVRESLYLLENRLFELLDVETAGEVERTSRTYQFTLAKLGVDIMTAQLIEVGEYVPAFSNREQAYQTHRDAIDPATYDTVIDCVDFMSGLFRGEWGNGLPSRDDILRAAVGTWKAIGSRRVFDGIEEGSTLVLRRCKAAHYPQNLRAFAMARHHFGKNRSEALRQGVHFSRFNAIDVLRTIGLVELGASVSDDFEHARADVRAYIERLGKCAGVSGDTVAKAITLYRRMR